MDPGIKKAESIPNHDIFSGKSNLSYIRLAHKISFGTAVLVFFLSGLVLLGWRINQHNLKELIHGQFAVSPAAAFTLGLLSLSLILQFLSWNPLKVSGKLLAGLAAIVGASECAETLSGADFGIDRFIRTLFIGQQTNVLPYHIWQMPALDSILLGMALVLLDRELKTGLRPATVLCLATLFVASPSLIGYAFGIPQLCGHSSVLASPLATGLLFAALSLATINSRVEFGHTALLIKHSAAGITARRMVAMLIAYPLVIGIMRYFWDLFGVLKTDLSMLPLCLMIILPLPIMVIHITDMLEKLEAARSLAEDSRGQAEHELRKSQDLNRSILETANDAFVAMDKDGAIRDWNTQAERLFGWTAREAIGRTVAETIIPEHFRDAHNAGFRQFLENGSGPIINKCVEVTGLHKNGYELPVELTVFPVASGNTFRFCAFIRDITERKEAERRVSEFYSVVSHELRTPLTSIRAALGLVEAGVVENGSAEALEMIALARDSSDRLIRLINDILDLKKIESGKMELNMSSVDVEEFVSQCVCSLSGMAEEAGIQVLHDTSGSGFVHADPDKATQILSNLISNAIKFSPSGAQVKVISRPTEHNKVRFCVIDNGPGIAPDDLPKLFGKFQQLDSSDTRLKGGTGLGLAISKALVEEHGGAIGLTSAKGQGSEFWFELPAFCQESKPNGCPLHSA